MQEDITQIITYLREGKVVLVPTDTDWGFLCDATQEDALSGLLAIYGSAPSQVVVLVDTTSRLQSYLSEVPDIVWDLTEMTEKPLTLKLKHARNLAPSLQIESFISFRVVTPDFIRTLCARMRRPLACISSGSTQLNDISTQLLRDVAFIADKVTAQFKNESVIELGDGNLFRIIKT